MATAEQGLSDALAVQANAIDAARRAAPAQTALDVVNDTILKDPTIARLDAEVRHRGRFGRDQHRKRLDFASHAQQVGARRQIGPVGRQQDFRCEAFVRRPLRGLERLSTLQMNRTGIVGERVM